MAKNVFIGANQTAKKVSNIYIGVANKARKVKKAYVGINGKARQFYPNKTGLNLTVSSSSGASSSYYWYNVVYANGKFVVVPFYTKVPADTKFGYSYDGINWTTVSIGSAKSQSWKVTYGNNKFVACGNQYEIAYSADGGNWTLIQNNNVINSPSIAYGNGKFVILSGLNSGFGCYSTNGVNWTKITFPNGYYIDTTYGNGKFVAIEGGSSNYNGVMYSSDGITWTKKSSALISAHWRSIVYGNNKFVATNDYENYKRYAAFSSDGISWSTLSSKKDTIAYSGIYLNGKFFFVSGKDITYSSDLTTWELDSSPISIASIAYGANKYVGVSEEGIVYGNFG